MNLARQVKKAIYFNAHQLVGIEMGREYQKMQAEDPDNLSINTTRQLLVQLFKHCRQNVPYYRDFMAEFGDEYQHDPIGYLTQFPVLTKDLIRNNFDRLKSDDLDQRKWIYNTTGGSTGEPLLFIQDQGFQARAGALQWLSHDWAGRSFGTPAIRVWASPGDIHRNTMSWKMNMINYLTNDRWFDGLRLTPARMREFLQEISENPPCLIIGYAECMYEMAKFAEREGIQVAPQKGIITSAGTLHPFMREKIESVFCCKVFNRYGSREVGDVACECEQYSGLHVFPWGSYVEIVDDDGQPLPPGVEGNIAVTSLANYAMPLIRYMIGDRGVLSPRDSCICGRKGQIMEKVSGRDVEMFITRNGMLVDGAYFAILLHMRAWVGKFQIVQKDLRTIEFRIVRSPVAKETQAELDEITEKTRQVMGPDCQVIIKFVEDIPPSPSGKSLYLFSEVRRNMEERYSIHV